VPIQAAPGTLVPLSSILEQSFGTADPNFVNLTLIKTTPFPNTSGNIGYWNTPDVSPEWFVRDSGGSLSSITSNTVVSNIADVWLEVGNQIASPAQFSVEATSGGTLRTSEDIVYQAWSIDPGVAAGVASRGIGGTPTPAAVIESAFTFANLYGPIPNNNLCNSIADNVAAGAGACRRSTPRSMPRRTSPAASGVSSMSAPAPTRSRTGRRWCSRATSCAWDGSIPNPALPRATPRPCSARSPAMARSCSTTTSPPTTAWK
jgi:hypothetical protein